MSDGQPREGVEETDFLRHSVERFSDWIKFAEAKAGGALVLLGLGAADLIATAGRLTAPGAVVGRWSFLPPLFFWMAVCAAGATSVAVWRSFFPRLNRREDSLFFFGDVAGYASPDDYMAAVRATTNLNDHVASQAWELARVAGTKFARTKEAYICVAVFGAFWIASRISLSLMT